MSQNCRIGRIYTKQEMEAFNCIAKVSLSSSQIVDVWYETMSKILLFKNRTHFHILNKRNL